MKFAVSSGFGLSGPTRHASSFGLPLNLRLGRSKALVISTANDLVAQFAPAIVDGFAATRPRLSQSITLLGLGDGKV